MTRMIVSRGTLHSDEDGAIFLTHKHGMVMVCDAVELRDVEKFIREVREWRESGLDAGREMQEPKP